MPYLIIFVLTLASCLIFEKIKLLNVVNRLIGSYKLQLNTMQDKALNDEEKQKVLMKQVGVQVRGLLTLILQIILFISPFILYALLDKKLAYIRLEYLYNWKGIGVSILAVFFYILMKKVYGRIL